MTEQDDLDLAIANALAVETSNNATKDAIASRQEALDFESLPKEQKLAVDGAALSEAGASADAEATANEVSLWLKDNYNSEETKAFMSGQLDPRTQEEAEILTTEIGYNATQAEAYESAVRQQAFRLFGEKAVSNADKLEEHLTPEAIRAEGAKADSQPSSVDVVKSSDVGYMPDARTSSLADIATNVGKSLANVAGGTAKAAALVATHPVEAAEAVAATGWSWAYELGTGIANTAALMADYATEPLRLIDSAVAKYYGKESDTQFGDAQRMTQNAINKLVGSSPRELAKKFLGSEYVENRTIPMFGDWNNKAAELGALFTGARVGTKAADLMLGLPKGITGTLKNSAAYKEASFLASKGIKPKAAIAELLNPSGKLSALKYGVTRAALGEAGAIAATFDGNTDKVYEMYRDSFTSSPILMSSLLAVPAALDSITYLRRVKGLETHLNNMASNTLSRKLGDLKAKLGHGDSVAGNAVPYVSAQETADHFVDVANDIAADINTAVSNGRLSSKMGEEALQELRHQQAFINDIANTNLSKLVRNKEEADIVRAATRGGNGKLLAAATKLQNLTEMDKAPIAGKEKLGSITADSLSKANKALDAKATKTGSARKTAMFIIDEDGKAYPFSEYTAPKTDAILGDAKVTADNGIYSAIRGSGTKQTGVFIDPALTAVTLDNWKLWDYLLQKSMPILLKTKVTDNGPVLVAGDLLARIAASAESNPLMARSMANMLEAYPGLSKYFITYSKSRWQKIADDGAANLMNRFIAQGIPGVTKEKATDIYYLADRLGLNVLDSERFAKGLLGENRLSKITGAADRSPYIDPNGAVPAKWPLNAAPTARKIVVTVDLDKAAQFERAENIAEVAKIDASTRQAQLKQVSANNSLLSSLAKAIGEGGVADAARETDKLVGSHLPPALSAFAQKAYGYVADPVIRAAQRITELMHNATYQWASNNMQNLKAVSEELIKDKEYILQLNKFKKLVNMGFEIDNDMTIKLRKAVDKAGNELSVPTERNLIAIERAESLGLINADHADAMRIGERINLPDLYTGEDLELSDIVTKFLDEYEALNDSLYRGKQQIGQIFGKNSGYNQPFHMNNKLGEYVNFIYDGDILVTTVTANTPKQLQEASTKELALLRKYAPGYSGSQTRLAIKTPDEVKRSHLINPDEEWLGWTNAYGDYEKLRYESGRLNRTSIGAAFQVDTTLPQTLYNDILNQAMSLSKSFQSAHFANEIKYAQMLKDGANEAERKTLEYYIGLLNGKSINESKVVTKFNEAVNKATDWAFSKFNDYEAAKANKEINDLWGATADAKAVESFVAKLPIKGGASITHNIQAFTNWSLLRFMRVMPGILNVLSTIPMSHLAVKAASKGQYETVAAWRNRVGAYGKLTTEGTKQFSSVDWLCLYASTLKSMFTKRNAEMFERARQFGYISDDAAMLRDITFVNPTLLNDTKRGNAARKLLSKFNKASTAVNDGTEMWARNFSFAMGEQLGRKVGLVNEDSLFAFAKQFADNVVGNYSAMNKPDVFRGAIPALAGTFKTYKLNVMQQLADTYAVQGPRALLAPLATQSVVFGGRSLPLAEVADQGLFGDNSDNTAYSKLMELTNGDDTLSRIALYGLPGTLLDADMTGRADIDPLRGGFTLDPNQWTPMISMMNDLGRSITETYKTVTSDTGLSFGRTTELLNTYAPIPAVRALAAFNNYGYDRDGNRYNYSVDRFGDIHRARLSTTLLGARDIETAEESRELRKQRAADTIRNNAKLVLSRNLKSAFRRIKNGSASIDADLIVNAYSDYINAGGTDRNFATYLQTQYMNATKDAVSERIHLLGASKNIARVKDIIKLGTLASYEVTDN